MVRTSRNWMRTKFGNAESNYTFDRFEQDVVDRVNLARKNGKMPPIKVDEELQIWLKATSARIKGEELDNLIKIVQAEQPRYFEVNVSSARSNSLQELSEKFSAVAAQVDQSSRHMGVLVRPQLNDYGYEAVLIIGRRLENFSPETVTERTTDTFFSICPHCKMPHACKVSLAQRGVNLDCPRCGLDYGVLAPDARGRFRYVNEYLTGYEPPARYPEEYSKLHEMFTIWKAVVARCSYTKDGSESAPNQDTWQTPLETMIRGKGDCEDSSLLLADWLISRGFNVRVALGRYGDMGQHAWCVVRVENVDYLLESTEGPPNEDKMPFVSDVGARYVPETLFDRDYIYVRANPHARFDGNYFDTKSWLHVQPRHLFDPAPTGRSQLASGASSESAKGNPTAPRPVVTATRTRRGSHEPTGIPMPPLTRLQDIEQGSTHWQLIHNLPQLQPK